MGARSTHLAASIKMKHRQYARIRFTLALAMHSVMLSLPLLKNLTLPLTRKTP